MIDMISEHSSFILRSCLSIKIISHGILNESEQKLRPHVTHSRIRCAAHLHIGCLGSIYKVTQISSHQGTSSIKRHLSQVLGLHTSFACCCMLRLA